jgi:hypothetical protein
MDIYESSSINGIIHQRESITADNLPDIKTSSPPPSPHERSDERPAARVNLPVIQISSLPALPDDGHERSHERPVAKQNNERYEKTVGQAVKTSVTRPPYMSSTLRRVGAGKAEKTSVTDPDTRRATRHTRQAPSEMTSKRTSDRGRRREDTQGA